YFRIPRGYAKLMVHPTYSYLFPASRGTGTNEPEYYVRGRALGGSSSINGMVYMRGLPSDYDSWNCEGWGWPDMLRAVRAIEDHQMGRPGRRGGGPSACGSWNWEGWGWPDMLRAFRAIEDHEMGASEWRGAGGPLHVTGH